MHLSTSSLVRAAGGNLSPHHVLVTGVLGLDALSQGRLQLPESKERERYQICQRLVKPIWNWKYIE